jgi:hypothetical protein
MTPVALLALGILVYLAAKVSRISRRWKELPPGPPTTPVLGNLHQLSPVYTHKLYAPPAFIRSLRSLGTRGSRNGPAHMATSSPYAHSLVFP